MITEKRRLQIKEYYRETYAWRKARGLCVRCGKELAVRDRVQCWQCRANESDRRKVVYEYRRQNRLCVQCGKPLDKTTTTITCDTCKNKRHRRHSE